MASDSATRTVPTASRSSGEARRRELLSAAQRVFGARGLHGASVEVIAREVGVSQPYVFQLFGSKRALFEAAFRSALDDLMAHWREALDADVDAGGSASDWLAPAFENLGTAPHRIVLQAATLGHEAEVGHAVRAGFVDVYRFLRDEAGLPGEQIRDFLARGLLVAASSTLDLASFAPGDPDAEGLLAVVHLQTLEAKR